MKILITPEKEEAETDTAALHQCLLPERLAPLHLPILSPADRRVSTTTPDIRRTTKIVDIHLHLHCLHLITMTAPSAPRDATAAQADGSHLIAMSPGLPPMVTITATVTMTLSMTQVDTGHPRYDQSETDQDMTGTSMSHSMTTTIVREKCP
ncbi:hypothetical protein ILYODFUR_017273 [Ilyodon furcidens]|uniref:Uncharacterized protein n=1 Tax=Ilyodon furcidens TaxID=33524 RepID=A0ABV0UAA8_9TELE